MGFSDAPHEPSQAPVRQQAIEARKSLTPHESRFWRESQTRWPGLRLRRYHDLAIRPAGTIGAILSNAPSVWYAPFYHAPTKTIIVIDHRDDFPYRIYGQNWKLYAQHGYTILDFSEDLSCPFDQSVWDEMMARIGAAITTPTRRAA